MEMIGEIWMGAIYEKFTDRRGYGRIFDDRHASVAVIGKTFADTADRFSPLTWGCR